MTNFTKKSGMHLVKTMNLFRKLVLILFASLSSFTAAAQYGGGSGTVDSPYLITTSDHLIALSSTATDWNKSFKLDAAIDMASQIFRPIGTVATPFTGTFDGDSNSISNLTITAPSDKLDGTGMFGIVSGSITNLGIVNIFGDYRGAAFDNWTRVGAIAGILNPGGSITKCYSKGGSLSVSGGWTGGIVGIIFAAGTTTIEDCFSSTAINASYGSGGVVGLNRGAHVINRVAFYGTISGGSAIATIQNDAADAQKNGIPATNAFFSTATGTGDANATGLNNAELLLESSYTDFNFTDTWKIDPNLGYAVLEATTSTPPAEVSFFEQLRTEKVISDQNILWKNLSPGTSGYCEEFWCHPTDVNTMFSGADMHAAFGTWDNGQSWTSIKDSDGTGIEMRRVIDIQFSLQDPDFGIAFANDQTGRDTSGRLYETTDRGRSWNVVSNMGKCHSKLAIHPTNDNIWLLGAGDFWNVKDNHRSGARPNGIKQGRSNYGYVWKTTDRGTTWKKVATDLAPNDLDVGRIVFDRTNPNNLIMATTQGMFRSTDVGETWTSSATGLPNNLPRDLTSYYNAATNEFILYAVEQTVYAPSGGSSISSTGGVYQSTDGGISWQSITGNLALNMRSITERGTRDSYHRTIANWLGISRNVSTSTYTTYPTSVLPTFNRIVVNPTNKDEIYLVHNKRHTFSFGPGDVWKSTNGGATWTATSRTGQYWITDSDKAYWESRNNPTGTNVDFSHMQRYMDDGREEISAARMLAINIEGDVFTGLDQQLLRSNNGGTSWEQADDIEITPNSGQWIGRGNNNLPGRFMLLETGVPGRKLLCSGEHGLWKTVDLGNFPDRDAVAIEQIEGQINSGGLHTAATVAVHPNDPDMIYILASRQEHRGKLRRSTDGGVTWANIATIFEASNPEFQTLAFQNSLIIDPDTPDNMYFCATRRTVAEVNLAPNENILTKGAYGVYRSNDGGFNWTLSNSGLPANGSVRRVTMDPANPSILYASINQFGNNDPGGLYKSTDGAVSWSQDAIPAEIRSVNNFFVDRNTGFLFLSAGARAGTLNAGGVWKSENDGGTWTRIFEAPFVWQTEVSPANSNIIVISAAAQIPTRLDEFPNPGIYLSMDAGATWKKINKGLAHAERTIDVKPDPVDQNVLWCAGWGSGWYKAKIDVASLSVDDVIESEDFIKLYPNPVKSGILKLSNIKNRSDYSIYTLQGKILKSGTIMKNEEINVSTISSGIYIIKIETGKEAAIETRKFIIQ